MHMSDALISPVVGGTMLTASVGVMKVSINNIEKSHFERRLPLMGVMGAFLFAAQMINFTIPGTGSSGHIGGGVLLAIILGPGAGFLTMASVLLIQALFFADGGLLAFGCNLINLGFFTCYVAYPLIYKSMTRKALSNKKLMLATLLASIVGLQLGSLGVVIETFLSGNVELDLRTFLLFMQPIHLVIGAIEGVITAVIINYLYNENPTFLYSESLFDDQPHKVKHNRVLIIKILIATLLVGGLLSLFASSNPDGLEWSMEKVATSEDITKGNSFSRWIEQVQETIAILPDYSFKENQSGEVVETSISGIMGSILTLALALLIGFVIRKKQRRALEDE